MKQKQLLIAFAALVLTACGGSIDLGPKIPGTPTPQPEPEPEPSGERTPYEILLTTDREWITKGNYLNEDDDGPEVEFIENGIQVWITDKNQQLATPVSGPLNLMDATVVFTVSADEDYLNTAPGMQPFQQVFTRDPGGVPDEDNEEGGNWGCWTGTGEWQPDEEVEVTCNVPNDEMYDLAEDQYALIGIQSQGDDNPEGYLRLHAIDLRYWADGVPEEEDEGGSAGLLELDTSAVGDWYVGDDLAGDDTPNSDAAVFTDAGVGFTPTFEGEWSPKLFYLLDGPLDLTGETVTVVFTVEQAFLDSEAGISAHIQHNFGSYTQFQCAMEDDLVADEPLTLVCADLPDTMVAGEGESLRVGIEISEGSSTDAGTITINSLSVTVPTDGVDVTDGWEAGDRDMDYTEDGARYFPTADDQQFYATVTGPLVMTGGNFVITVSGDEDFIASGANIQPFAQGIENGDKAVWSCWINGGADLADGPVEAVCPDDGFPEFELEEGETAKFGIQAKPGSDPIQGSVTVHSLIINPGE